MRFQAARPGIGALVALICALPAYGQGTQAEIAAVAAAQLLRRHPTDSVKVNPLIMSADAAPPAFRAGGVRDSSRSASIAARLSARVARPESALVCDTSGARCTLRGPSTYVSLSEPSIWGDSAQITVTAQYRTGSRRQPEGYETVRFTLVRSAGRWLVAKEEQLGIS